MDATHTPGPWHVFNMVNEDGSVMTAEQIGEYVKASVIKSIEHGGSANRFLFVACSGEGGPDICHVGNGPTGPRNAVLISAAPDLLDACMVAARYLDPRHYADAIKTINAAITKATNLNPEP